MKRANQQRDICQICGKAFPHRNLFPAMAIREPIVDLIREQYPQWSSEGFICRSDLAVFRTKYIERMIASERGEMTALENEVVRSLREHEVLASNTEQQFERGLTLGQRLADKVAVFGGSWTFIGLFAVFMGVWIGGNSIALMAHPFDPYPYILLNLILSCIAAIQAPIIMMSQNRQEAKDRMRGQHDYQINLKAELEIRHLHEKMDHLLSKQWERLVEIQQLQLALLTEMSHGVKQDHGPAK
ncbi:MAG: DUF1003 domain-containing protein [Gammaproteobacteria bacterium]|nr:DUF1003 domain-containing protein [Gammaproteobacteria bacterium]